MAAATHIITLPIGGSLSQLRRDAEHAVERLLALLDSLDGDPDMEDGGDTEANLAGFGYDYDDRELDESDDEDGGDNEHRWMRPETFDSGLPAHS